VVDKLFGLFLGGIVSELKSHPWTTLSAAFALGGVVYFGNVHASADDMKAVAIQIRDIRAAQIEDKLLNARERYCHSEDEQQQRYFRQLVSDYQQQYRTLMGEHYVLPSCAEV